MIIKLEPSALNWTQKGIVKPLLYINKIVFITDDGNWSNRLFGAELHIKFTCKDNNESVQFSSEELFVFGAYISPYHRQPVLEINKLFSIEDEAIFINNHESKNWEILIELKNLNLLENECIEILTGYNSTNTIDEIIIEVDRGKKIFYNLNYSIQELLKLIPNFRLDWSLDNEQFSDEFNIGVTKPILLSGLVNQNIKIKNNKLLFEKSKIAKLLVDTFIIEKNLNIELLKEIHRLIIKNGGSFREQNVVIGENSSTINPSFSKVSDIEYELNSLINWYNLEISNNKLHPLFICSIFHYNLVKIHPFLDGNGRLARVISSLILLSFNIPPPISDLRNRPDYLTAIRSADKGDIIPITVFIGKGIIQSINYALTIKP